MGVTGEIQPQKADPGLRMYQQSLWLLYWHTYVQEEASCTSSIVPFAADVCCSGIHKQQGVWDIWYCLNSQDAHNVLWIQAQDPHLRHMPIYSSLVSN